MLKRLLLIAAFLLTIRAAQCATIDTIVTYYKDIAGRTYKMPSLREADYFRVLIPTDSTRTVFDILEFYKNGKRKMVAKGKIENLNTVNERTYIDGIRVTYFPNGKRRDVATYVKGDKDGDEYMYYPDGSIYALFKNDTYRFIDIKKWDCYNKKGEQICKNGNGQWETYDDSFDYVTFAGTVKDGKEDGEWHGISILPDTIKYTMKFKKGDFISGNGYDKTGKAYPFTTRNDPVYFRGGFIKFVEILDGYLSIPKNADGTKPTLAGVSISFIVEKNDEPSNVQVLGSTSDALNEAIIKAFNKCSGWGAGKYYGIPYRVQLTFPLEYLHEYVNNNNGNSNVHYNYHKEVQYQQRILGF